MSNVKSKESTRLPFQMPFGKGRPKYNENDNENQTRDSNKELSFFQKRRNLSILEKTHVLSYGDYLWYRHAIRTITEHYFRIIPQS